MPAGRPLSRNEKVILQNELHAKEAAHKIEAAYCSPVFQPCLNFPSDIFKKDIMRRSQFLISLLKIKKFLYAEGSKGRF